MQNYFRLLFVGSILFILLGTFNRHAENLTSRQDVIVEIQSTEFQSGMMPVFHSVPDLNLFPARGVEGIGNSPSDTRQLEYQGSIKVRDKFARLESEATNRRPDIFCKTGQFLHLSRADQDPSTL